MAALKSIGDIAVHGIFWSVIQNWGGRFITFFLFIFLARFLTPTDYGLGTAAILVLNFVLVIAEFGFGDAIVQRPKLEDADVNLPFLISMGTAVVLAGGVALFAPLIEHLANVPGLTPVLIVLCSMVPIQTLALFQEAIFRRHLKFQKLALRILIANVTSGVVAVICAYFGAGVWSLVIQSYLGAIIGAIWLWWKPIWRAGLELRRKTFFQLGRFGLPVVGMRAVDFVGLRFIDVIILTRYGVAVFGFYALGAKLFQTLMSMLLAVLNDVSLTVLSKIADDRERMARIYLQATQIAAFVSAPIFVMVSALSPEICNFMLGAKWHGVEQVMGPLMLLGAVLSVQYLSGAYLSARGRPSLVFYITLSKYALLIVGLLFLPSHNVHHLVWLFVGLNLMITPVTFTTVLWNLGIRWRTFLANLLPSVIGCALTYVATSYVRPIVHHALPPQGHAFLLLATLGIFFGLVYLAVIAITGRKQMLNIWDFIQRRRHKTADTA